MRLWKITARELRCRPGRSLLTLLSIAVAVAAVVAVSLSTASTRRASYAMYESVAGRAALEVVAADGRPYDQDVLRTLQQTAGVSAAIPALRQPTVMFAKGRHVRLLSLAIDPARDALIRDYEVVEGHFLGDSPGVLLQAGFAHALGIGVGDEVKFLTRRGLRPLPVAGLLAPRGLAGLNQGGTAVLSLPIAQRMFVQRGKISEASLLLKEGAEASTVLAEVSRRLPPGLLARKPPARTELAEHTLQSVEQGLVFAYALIIVLAVFLVLNTFLMNVGQRRGQLAILRALGATRGQLVGMLLSEGLALGAGGTVLGCVAGWGSAHLLAAAMGGILAAPPPDIVVGAVPFVLGAAVGLGAAAAGAYFPARMAGRIAPLEGMRPAVSHGAGALPRWLPVASLGLYGVAATVVTASLEGLLPNSLLLPGGVAVLMASVIFLAALLRPLVWGIAWMLTPWRRVESALARRQLLCRRARTILTVALLYLAVATGIGLGTTILNNVRDVRRWHKQTVVGDFYVSTLSSNPVAELSPGMPAKVLDELKAVPGVTNVVPVRFFTSHVDDQLVMVIAGDYAAAPQLPLDLEKGDPEAVARQLQQGEVVIGAALAQRTGLRAGDELALQSPRGPVRLRIADTVVSYASGGLIVSMDCSVAKRVFGIEGADMFVVYAPSGSLSDVRARLEALTGENGLTLYSVADVRRAFDAAASSVVSGLWGLLALGFVVALLGIANTLAMNVLEQTREIAVLRVVGMTRAQVRSAVFAQAFVMGVVGLAGGVIGGLLTAYMIHLSLPSLVGRRLLFAVSPPLIAGCCGAALGVALLAAWWPARRAARLNLLIALRYE